MSKEVNTGYMIVIKYCANGRRCVAALQGFKYPPELQSVEYLAFHRVYEPNRASLLQVVIRLLIFLIFMARHRRLRTALFLWLITPLVPISRGC